VKNLQLGDIVRVEELLIGTRRTVSYICRVAAVEAFDGEWRIQVMCGQIMHTFFVNIDPSVPLTVKNIDILKEAM
jgi:hypothetical protein